MAACTIHILCVAVYGLCFAEALPASEQSRLMLAARRSSLILDDGSVQIEQSRSMRMAGRSSFNRDDGSVQIEVPAAASTKKAAKTLMNLSPERAKEPETSPTSLVDGTRRPVLNHTNLNFGGLAGKEKPRWTDPFQSFPRPEYAKSLVCTGNTCEDCSHEFGVGQLGVGQGHGWALANANAGCWHGGAVPGSWANNVNVAWNDTHDSHVLDVWARCNGSDGNWRATLTRVHNAELEVYIDGVMFSTLIVNQTLTLPIKNGEARVRIVLRRLHKIKGAFARVVLIAVDVDESFDQCMSHKVCLSELDDGSNASHDFRNMNTVQKQCLEGQTDIMNTEAQDICTVWKICLTEDMQKTLLTFLRAAIPNTTKSLLDGGAVAGSAHGDPDETQDDPNSCVDPAIDDPESWYCECLPEMIAACNDEVDEVCFRKQFCDHASVCQHWKDDNCDSSLMAIAIERRSAVNSNTTGGTDITLQGKCGSNEV